MSNKIYDILKFFCLTISPALIVFINAVLPTVGVSVETVKTITTIISALATFIGTILGISSNNYSKTVEATAAIAEAKAETVKEVAVSEEEKLADDEVEFHGKTYKKTGKATQIIAQYAYSDETYDYVENLYGDGSTKLNKSKILTDAEKEAKYEKMVTKYPQKYPVSWAYDFELTLNENLQIAAGNTTKEEISKKRS